MNELLVLCGAIGLGMVGVLGVAYSLDVRRQKHGSIGGNLPRPGPWGRALWWGARLLTALMLLSVIGAYLSRAPALAWLAAGSVLLFVADHVAYQLMRLTGK